ncbi:MAG: DinB family protein [Alicyclobacillaceae bacterium]|nr:DinB family protein [Alicyclobacillaceae bacterium]
MYQTIQEFIEDWRRESRITQNALDVLTDESLSRRVSPKDRTLGELAWHIVTAPGHMLAMAGLPVEMPGDPNTRPASARQMADAHRRFAEQVTAVIAREWTDATLREVRNMFGEQWPNALTLQAIIRHEIHHRGQLTVLMRQAGLPVPDIYGPARRD